MRRIKFKRKWFVKLKLVSQSGMYWLVVGIVVKIGVGWIGKG